jgi:hypothetical protein
MIDVRSKLITYISKNHNIQNVDAINRGISRILESNGSITIEDILAQYVYNDTCKKYNDIIAQEYASAMSTMLME